MQFPKKITPCPLVEALFWMQYETECPIEVIYGVLYKTYKDLLPKKQTLPAAAIPKDARDADPNLRVQPHYRMENDNIILQLSPSSVGLSILNDYPGWGIFSAEILQLVESLNDSACIDRATKISLRYINSFSQNILQGINVELKIYNSSVSAGKTLIRTTIDNGKFSSVLNVANEVSMRRGEVDEDVAVIDVEVTESEGLEGFLLSPVQLLNDLHIEEKRIFFELLKKPFLDSLSPEY